MTRKPLNDPLMYLAELDQLLAEIGFRERSRVRTLVTETVEAVWQHTPNLERHTA